MDHKDRVFAAMNHEAPDRVPRGQRPGNVWSREIALRLWIFG
jgi:hypothetical protein